MAQYWWDATKLIQGDGAPDWLFTNTTGEIVTLQGEPCLQLGTDLTSRAVWTAAGFSRDVEIYTKDMHVSGTAGMNLGYAGMRMSQTGDIGYYLWGHHSNEIRLLQFIPEYSILAWASYTQSTLTKYKTLVSLVGNQLRSKIWADTEQEPTTWRLEITSTDITNAGYCGVGTYLCTNAIFEFGIGTEGDPAPRGPIDEYRFQYDPDLFAITATGIPTLSLPGVIDITATSARPQVTLTY